MAAFHAQTKCQSMYKKAVSGSPWQALVWWDPIIGSHEIFIAPSRNLTTGHFIIEPLSLRRPCVFRVLYGESLSITSIREIPDQADRALFHTLI